MRRHAVLALAALSCSALAQSPPPLEASYQWSLSGNQYALASRRLREPWPTLPGIGLDLALGLDVRTKATVWGPGVSYRYDDPSGLTFAVGASFLLGAQKPDVALGVGIGFKF